MLFIVDFDGTLSLKDTVDAMLERFADPSWQVIEQDWQAGKMTAVECMSRQVGMVQADRVSLEKFFREIELDMSFLPFYDYVSQFARVAIVSDGLDHAVEVAMRNRNFPVLPIYSNKLHFVPSGIEISFPNLSASCTGGNGTCKCAIANSLALASGGPIVLIGDGKSDACLAGKADVVFAKDSLVKHCQTHNIAHHAFHNFAQVLEQLVAWPIQTLLPTPIPLLQERAGKVAC